MPQIVLLVVTVGCVSFSAAAMVVVGLWPDFEMQSANQCEVQGCNAAGAGHLAWCANMDLFGCAQATPHLEPPLRHPQHLSGTSRLVVSDLEPSHQCCSESCATG
jgi:hypothetical protein